MHVETLPSGELAVGGTADVSEVVITTEILDLLVGEDGVFATAKEGVEEVQSRTVQEGKVSLWAPSVAVEPKSGLFVQRITAKDSRSSLSARSERYYRVSGGVIEELDSATFTKLTTVFTEVLGADGALHLEVKGAVGGPLSRSAPALAKRIVGAVPYGSPEPTVAPAAKQARSARVDTGVEVHTGVLLSDTGVQ